MLLFTAEGPRSADKRDVIAFMRRSLGRHHANEPFFPSARGLAWSAARRFAWSEHGHEAAAEFQEEPNETYIPKFNRGHRGSEAACLSLRLASLQLPC